MSLAALLLASCTSAFYSAASGSAYDDLYASHDRTAILMRQQAEAEVRRAEAEARRAEAEALQAQYEAEVARMNAVSISTKTQGQHIDSDGLVIIEDNIPAANSYQGFVADSYESAYARRLQGFKSASYRMPSSYFNLRYGGSYAYATAYDPAFYNVMVSGDQIWVEPRYITSMFGTWGATNATAMLYSPWYYGWNSWHHYDPWYYSWHGYPHYSWYDWNWNICYGGGWGVNLWWGWGGHYHPWRPHYSHYNPHHHYIGHAGPVWGGNWWHRGGYGSRHEAPRVVGNRAPAGKPQGAPSRTGSIVNRGSVTSTPYRSPSTGSTYGQSSRGTSNATAAQNSVGRGSATVGRGSATSSSQSTVSRGSSSTSTSRGSATTTSSSSTSSRNRTVSPSSSSSSSKSSSVTSSSASRSRSTSTTTRSSSSSSSSSSSRSSYSSSSSSRSGGGYSGGFSGGYSGGSSSRGGGSTSSGSSRGGR